MDLIFSPDSFSNLQISSLSNDNNHHNNQRQRLATKRLDMKHGFFQHIIANQIDRLEFVSLFMYFFSNAYNCMIEERKKLSTVTINRSRSRAHNQSLLLAATRFLSVYCPEKQQKSLFTITYIDDNTRLYRDVHAVSYAVALDVRQP